MWSPQNIEYKKKENTTDFYLNELTDVYFDDMLMFKSIELLDFQEDEIQTIICDCGMVRCASGNYVKIRKVSNYFIILPSFEHTPERVETIGLPKILAQKGPICLSEEKFKEILQANGVNILTVDFKPLLSPELVNILRWQAPVHLFAYYNNQIQIESDLLVASSSSDNKKLLNNFSSLINAWANNDYELDMFKAGDHKISMYFYVNNEVIEWCPGYQMENTFGLMLAPDSAFKIRL